MKTVNQRETGVRNLILPISTTRRYEPTLRGRTMTLWSRFGQTVSTACRDLYDMADFRRDSRQQRGYSTVRLRAIPDRSRAARGETNDSRSSWCSVVEAWRDGRARVKRCRTMHESRAASVIGQSCNHEVMMCFCMPRSSHENMSMSMSCRCG